MSRALLKLYDQLEAHGKQKNNSWPSLLRTLCEHRDPEPVTQGPKEVAPKGSERHLGQMTGRFPLGRSQRQSLHAVLRLKDGEMSGLLAEFLFREDDNALNDVIARPELLTLDDVQRLTGIQAHRDALREALRQSQRRVLIVSPYLSKAALDTDDVDGLIEDATQRGIQVKKERFSGTINTQTKRTISGPAEHRAKTRIPIFMTQAQL